MRTSSPFFIKNLLTLFLSAALFMACEKDENDIPAPVTHQPAPKPVGNTIGNITTKHIGPEGGIVSSPDGKITLSIPAGALASSTEIGIQPITNTNPGGVGNGFRLTPHGTQFSKDITITASYENESEINGYPFALGISYQDNSGVWQLVPKPVVNNTAKTVSIKTNHFSDWVMMLWMRLLPMEASMKTNEELDLRAVIYVPAAIDEEGILTPLVPSGEPAIPVGDAVDLEKEHIKKWDISSGGGVLESEGAHATYFSPSHAPAMNPVAVSVALNSTSQQQFLVSNITIVEEGVQIRINGGPWIKTTGLAMITERNTVSIVGASQEIGNIHLIFPGRKGSFNWSSQGSGPIVDFAFYPISRVDLYISKYQTSIGDMHIDSGGQLEITEYGQTAGSTIAGKFTISPAGHYSYDGEGRILSAPTIEGRFSVLRNN